MIEAYAYTDSRGQYVPADEIETVEENGEMAFFHNGERVNREFGKMGKSLKNTVTPDEINEQYGADTFRVYEMSMGPLEQSRVWESRAVVGRSASCSGCGATWSAKKPVLLSPKTWCPPRRRHAWLLARRTMFASSTMPCAPTRQLPSSLC